jgi:putative Mn2+ efflux pump MntP
MQEIYKMPKRKKEKKQRISLRFASILAIVSIIGFCEIILNSFFNLSFQEYISFLWLTLLGIGFILESKPKSLHKRKSNESVTNITSLVVGGMAIIAGILSIPQIGINHPVFFATKGVISLIAIIFIAIETWVVKN